MSIQTILSGSAWIAPSPTVTVVNVVPKIARTVRARSMFTVTGLVAPEASPISLSLRSYCAEKPSATGAKELKWLRKKEIYLFAIPQLIWMFGHQKYLIRKK